MVVALHVCNGLRNENTVLIALAKYGVVLVETGIGRGGDEELRAVGIWPGIGHGQTSRHFEIQIRIDFVGNCITRVAFAGAQWVTALNHEAGNHAMEDGPVIEWLVVHGLVGLSGIRPVFRSLRQANKVSHGFWCLL